MHKKIRIQLICWFTASLILTPLFSFSQAHSKRQVFDYVFLLDTSGSMVGKPTDSGNIVIFPRVKEAIREFLGDIEPPANVFVFPFDEGLRDTRLFSITSREDINSIQEYIENLKAEGRNTWIYRSLKDVMDRIEELKEGRPGEEHIVITYLYTDGVDNDRMGPYTMQSIMDTFDAKRGEYDWLFYVTLGVQLSQHDTQILGRTGHVSLIKEEKGRVSPIILIKNKVLALPYGNLWRTGEGKMTALFSIHGEERIPKDTKIRIEPEFPELSSKGMGVSIFPFEFTPTQTKDITMKLVNFRHEREVCKGTHDVKFKMSTTNSMVFVIPDSIDVTFKYEQPLPMPWWKKILFGFIGLIVLYGIGILLYCMVGSRIIRGLLSI